MTLPSPGALLGIPDRFPSWYPGQTDAFNQLMNWYHSPARFVGVSCPTGSGKSLLALLTARLSGARTVILTATKGLQQQYLRDCQPIGGVLVMGRNNFRCPLVPSLRADEGPCNEGMPCDLRATCPYRVQLNKALNARIVITNYAYYLAQTNFSSGLGDVGLLILDESHLAFGAMESYLTVSLSRLDIEPLGLTFPESADKWEVWRTWACGCFPVAQEAVSELEAKSRVHISKGERPPSALSRSLRTAKSVTNRLFQLSNITDGWVVMGVKHGYRFVPKWVADYHAQLFGEIPKVALVSAILSTKTAATLGVPLDDCGWVESPSYFPVANTPIWHIHTVRLNHRMDDYAATAWVSRIDQIIQRRPDRKGIVFTVSYERARLLLSRSRFKSIMLTHSTGDVMAVVRKFRDTPPPMVLVSPTVTTGWDFPEARYLIVGKVPYPDTRDIVVRSRYEDDKSWTSYLAMDTFVQECGRGTRSFNSKCEVFCVDDSFLWFYWKNKDFAPAWFQERVRGSLQTVPDPLV